MKIASKVNLSLLMVILGAAWGLGLFTFNYAEGFSYFSSDPKACINCHIMNDNYNSWTKSSHHAAATCVQCHLPSEMPGKLIAKAINGYYHSTGFTLMNFKEPIMIKESNKKILQQNCLNCHGAVVHDLVKSATTDHDAIDCIHCHVGVGHGSPN
jgi:cytochrome c nitrite reductase small subunit